MSVFDGGLFGSSGSGGGGGGGISAVVEDLTPQLGGALDLNGNSNITNAGNINLYDQSTGVIRLGKNGSIGLTYNDSLKSFFPGSSNNIDFGYTTLPIQTVHVGTAIRLKSASDPSTLTDSAHVYAKDVSASSEVFVQDEGGTATQISEHSRVAPDFLYDDEDDIIDRVGFEIQYFQGFVRFTNKTRIGLLASMTDAEKSALTTQQRQCVYKESFADYNTRVGENLVVLDWDTEQARLQAEYDARRTLVLAEIEIQESLKEGATPKELLAIADELETLSIRLEPNKDIKKPKPSWI